MRGGASHEIQKIQKIWYVMRIFRLRFGRFCRLGFGTFLSSGRPTAAPQHKTRQEETMDKVVVLDDEYEEMLVAGEVRLIVCIQGDGLTVLLRGTEVVDWDAEGMLGRMPQFDGYVLLSVHRYHGFPEALYQRTARGPFDPLTVQSMRGTFLGRAAQFKFLDRIGVGPTLCDWHNPPMLRCIVTCRHDLPNVHGRRLLNRVLAQRARAFMMGRLRRGRSRSIVATLPADVVQMIIGLVRE